MPAKKVGGGGSIVKVRGLSSPKSFGVWPSSAVGTVHRSYTRSSHFKHFIFPVIPSGLHALVVSSGIQCI